MSDKNREREYELKAHMRELEQQRDELDTNMKTIWQREDDTDMELVMSNRVLEQMESGCSPNDKVILQLMEEKQQMMYAMRNKRAEFTTELENEIKKKRQQIDWEMEDTQREIVSINQQKADDESEQSNTEERDRERLYDRE